MKRNEHGDRKANRRTNTKSKSTSATTAKTTAKAKTSASTKGRARPTTARDRKVPRTRTVVLDHVSLPVRDIKTARSFYSAALGAIGMNINLDFSTAFGMGSRNENIFWLTRDRRASGGAHYSFRVDHREEVDAFHAAALEAGGNDHGKPGPRPNYGPRYYAAFVKDPEDNNVEVVCYK